MATNKRIRRKKKLRYAARVAAGLVRPRLRGYHGDSYIIDGTYYAKREAYVLDFSYTVPRPLNHVVLNLAIGATLPEPKPSLLGRVKRFVRNLFS